MKHIERGKIRQSLERQEEKRKQGVAEVLQKIYNKPRTIEFVPVEELNMNLHVYIPKFLKHSIQDWGLPSFALYPVLACRANYYEEMGFQISRDNIKKLTGMSLNSVDSGIGALLGSKADNRPILKREADNKEGRDFYKYNVLINRISTKQGQNPKSAMFHRALVDSGVWASLPLRCKALYFALRQVSYWDPDIATALRVKPEYRAERPFEVVTENISNLFKRVNMSPQRMEPVFKELEYWGLVERYKGVMLVYMHADYSKMSNKQSDQ